MSPWSAIDNKLEQGTSLTAEDGLFLLTEAELLDVAQRADAKRRQLHPQGRVTFVVDRNVNYSNVCLCQCRFCAFYRSPQAADAYVLSHDEIAAKVAELAEAGGTQLLMQGGTHPHLRLDWFESLFARLKQCFPQVQIHSLSPAEVLHLAQLEGISPEVCIQRLHEAGLDSIPGGGAEILVDRVRQQISPNKVGVDQWLQVMRLAHEQGMRSSATMMFGHVETPAEVVTHLLRLRQLQAETGGFTAFIGWSYQPGNTDLGGRQATGTDYLRLIAVARLMLDNIPNIQASWVTQGARMAQVALFFGANDLGGTMLEENVVKATGVGFRLSQDEVIALARGAGFVPAKRNTHYQILEEYHA